MSQISGAVARDPFPGHQGQCFQDSTVVGRAGEVTDGISLLASFGAWQAWGSPSSFLAVV